MNGKALASGRQADDEPELNLVLAIIRRAHLDAAYQPRPGTTQPAVLPEERQEAEQFLEELQAAWTP